LHVAAINGGHARLVLYVAYMASDNEIDVVGQGELEARAELERVLALRRGGKLPT